MSFYETLLSISNNVCKLEKDRLFHPTLVEQTRIKGLVYDLSGRYLYPKLVAIAEADKILTPLTEEELSRIPKESKLGRLLDSKIEIPTLFC